MGSGLQLEPLRDLDGARAEWSELADRSGNPFATWEWCSAWWRHFGASRALHATACRRADGTLAAILPLCLERAGPLRVLRFIGHGPGDRLGPICAPGDRELAAGALRETIAELSWDVFLAERLPAGEEWGRRLGAGATLQRESSPSLRLDGISWEELLAHSSANLRSQVRRRERRLARSHELRYRLAEDPARLRDDLATLAALHEARWGSAGSGALGPRRLAFHGEFAALALERGWLRLVFLELDGTPAAAWYGLRFAGADWYYQSGRDPARGRDSVGFVLLSHTIRSACEDGMGAYHFLRGDEAYKSRFADGDEQLETLALAHGAFGRGTLRAARLLDSTLPYARDVFMRALS